MLELKNKIYHDDEYNIDINCYLTHAQIQQIVEAVIKFDNWAERQKNIDMLVLYHATNISKEDLEELGSDAIVQSGLTEAVKEKIENYYLIQEGINYTESIQRALKQLVENMPNMIKPLQEMIEKYGFTNSK